MHEVDTAPTVLHRVLSPLGVTFLTFSALSPAFSVYVGGDVVLHIAGTGAALAFLLGGLTAAILGVLYAEVGAAFPGAGGVYPSLTALLGPQTAFPYVVLMLPVAVGQVAIAALGLADFVRVLVPGAPYLGVAFAALVGGALLSILDIKRGALVTGVFLGIEVISLLVIVGESLGHPVHSLPWLLTHPVMVDKGVLTTPSVFVLGLATVSGMWACGGASWALYFAEEMHEARRKIGRVIAWIGVLAAASIATPMILMLMSLDDPRHVLAAEAPFAAYLAARAGPAVTAAVSVGVSFAIFNSLAAAQMAYSRYLYATGRDGLWPAPVSRFLGQLHPRFRSPMMACLILTVAGGAMCLAGERAVLILISGNVADYALMALAILVGRRIGRTGKDFRAPLHPAVPLFGLTVTVLAVIADLLDPQAGRPSILILAGLFVGALIYFRFRLRESAAAWRVGGAEAPAAD
ncbi:MAG: APC family permease [Alphaproteobacteria bacterium]|nr:APC family permease [Alphaproteobacteria bacterium]